MPEEIEFSIMAPDPGELQPLLEAFEAEHGVHVRLQLLTWDIAWRTFVRSALYGDGPDVSEIGTTWLGDMVGMNALRPFNAAEVASFGKASAFTPAAWKTVIQAGDAHVWGIPWLTGARLLYYRPALLERAGVDPGSAFQSNQTLAAAVSRLQAASAAVPWTVPTGYTHTTLLNIASWVWAAGGDFLSADGRSTRFMEPASLEGMRAYFDLGRYLAPQVRHLNGLEPDEHFLSEPGTALTLSGPWLFCEARRRGHLQGDSIAVALPPGPSFVGGSNLMIWKHSRNPEAAVKLVRFLTQKAAQVAYCPYIGLLPARLEALAEAPFSSDPFWQVAARGVESGRIFPTIRLWGLVEDRLTAGFSAVWADLLADPSLKPETTLEKHLAPLAARLEPLLKQG
jgi:multiple sugar transport system substrate-binding protein